MTKVKICCIKSKMEAELAIQYGANVLGLVGNMPSGPGIIDDATIFEIAQSVPKHIETFLLTSETETEKIIEHYQKAQTTAIQIVDTLTKGSYAVIKAALPTVKLVQVLHILDESSIAKAKALEGKVDILLLDSGNPNLAIKELGGTGRVHNWTISQQIVKQVDLPVFLAGGLKANNAKMAIRQVQSYGLDLCSGVRTNDKLDEKKLKSFFMAVQEANR